MTNSAQDPKQTSNPFGDLDNKSLESEQTEAKSAGSKKDRVLAAEPPAGEYAPEPDQSIEPGADTIAVTMLHHGNHDGEPLVPGKTYDLPRHKALSLVASHRAKTEA